MQTITTIGLDIAKSHFSCGQVSFRLNQGRCSGVILGKVVFLQSRKRF
jgi:hypothetical protein